MQGKQIVAFKAPVGSTLEGLDPITAGDGSTHNQIKMESSSGSIECFKIKPALEGDRPHLQPSQSQRTGASGPKAMQLPLSSRFTGVRWKKKDSKWTASIRKGGRQKHLGSFTLDEEEAAARAFDAKARELRGPEAHGAKFKLNFPTVEEEWHRLAAVDAAATLKPNQLPVSHFVGVNWHKKDHKWMVNIKDEGISKYIGRFARDEEEAAARAYDAKARELRGPEAHGTKFKLNFPTPEEEMSDSRQAFLQTMQIPQSGFTGVHWNKRKGKWVVHISHERKKHHIGYFSREQQEVAARAFDAAARRLRGPEAHGMKFKLNFPTAEEQKNLRSSTELTTQPIEITNELLNDHETINELFDDHLPLTLQIKDEWTPQPMMMGVADHHQLLPSVNSFSDNNDEENEAVSQQQQPLQEHLTTSPFFALDDPSDTEPPPHSYYDVSNQPPAVLGNDGGPLLKIEGEKPPFFAPFIYKNDNFAKTGSGQT
jgi:hypothetical protein